MLTVYLDSNFYVWLAREDDLVAARCIDQLNALQVRHVVSLPLVGELFSSRPRIEANKRLHARVTRLTLPPLLLLPDFSWDALRGPPVLLEQFAQVVRLTDDRATEARSHGLVANQMTEEQQGLWAAANPQFANALLDEGDVPFAVDLS